MAEKEKKKENTEKKDGNSPEKMKAYDKLIEKLQKERDVLSNEMRRDYREARRYVRSHPEEGVLIGFIGGIALGVVLGRLMK